MSQTVLAATTLPKDMNGADVDAWLGKLKAALEVRFPDPGEVVFDGSAITVERRFNEDLGEGTTLVYSANVALRILPEGGEQRIVARVFADVTRVRKKQVEIASSAMMDLRKFLRMIDDAWNRL